MGSSLTRLNLTFEDIERSLDQLKFLLIQTFFFFWSHEWGFTHCNSIFDFQGSV